MTALRLRSIANILIGVGLLGQFSLLGLGQISSVTTVAGGYIGDGGPATAAAFNGRWLYATEDSTGNLFISDSPDSRVRKVNAKGIITTIAGTGIYGYSGDGGPAKSAKLSYPRGIAVDKAGNVFFSDSANRRVRKIDTHGIITTFAGNGGYGPPGDGGPAVNADLFWPGDLFLDSKGNLYIADDLGPTIRMVDTTGIIHLVAGVYGSFGYSGDGGPATSAELNYPEGLALDTAGNLYVADRDNSRIRKVDSTGTITTFAGNGSYSCADTGDGGPAASASVPYPGGLVVQRGRLLIADTCSRIRAVNLHTNVIAAVAGTGTGCFNGDGHTPLSTDLCGPWALSLDSAGNLLETESGGRIRRITNAVKTVAGGDVGDGGSATKASLTGDGPGTSLAFDALGNLYIADPLHMRVRKMDSHGVITTFAGTGMSGSSGNGGPATSATLSYPNSVAADRSGNVFLADVGVRKVDVNGIITAFSTGFSFVIGLATDASGNLYAADAACVVWKITSSGTAAIFAGVRNGCGYNGDGIPATQAELWPQGVATDAKGNVYIADYMNNRIRMVDTSGTITTVAGNGNVGFGGDGGPATSAELFMPQGVSVDKNGNLYIADTGNMRVRMVNPAGTIQTMAGTGFQGYNGDRLPATQTNAYPLTVTTNANGTAFLMDGDGYRVRRIK